MSIIYIAKTSSRKDFVIKVIKIFEAQLDQAKSIFIKPNIVSFEPYPTTTHPTVLDTLLSHLSDRTIIVGDGHAVDTGYTKNNSTSKAAGRNQSMSFFCIQAVRTGLPIFIF